MGDVHQLRPRLADGEVGCDRLSLSFPVAGFDPDAFDKRNGHFDVEDGGWRTDTYSTVVAGQPDGPMAGCSVMVGVQLLRGRPWGKVEANPSRFADPQGCSLLPLQLLEQSVEVMATLVDRQGVVAWVDPEAWRVKRLDLARDFTGVVAPRFYINGLAGLHRNYNKRTGVWSDAQCGSAETLHVGSGAGMFRLYDQFAAYAKRGAEPGDVRCEGEFRPGWLERHNIKVVNDLTVGRCEDAMVERFAWSRMGETVTGVVNVVEAVERMVAAGGYPDRSTGEWVALTNARADALCGALFRESLGSGSVMSSYKRAEFNRFTRALGVTPSAELLQGADVTVCGRLDFATGREVAA